MYGVIDIGTTGVKLSIYDENLRKTHYEKTVVGFEKISQQRIEQNSLQIANAVRGFVKKAREKGVKKMGICTYRASILAWRNDGTPITNIITWIDGRGKEVLERLSPTVKFLKRFSRSLNVILSPDSPAILMRWVYDNIPRLIEEVKAGKAYVWTLDSYILYILTGKFLADATNATLTGLIHPRNLSEIDIVFELLKLPKIIPEVTGNTHSFGSFEDIEVSACIADQQAASVGFGVLGKGEVQSTHGTGSFVETVTEKLAIPTSGLVPIIVLRIDDEKTYGLEGFVRSTGSTLEWLMKIGLFKDYSEAESLLKQFEKRVLLVPSLGGFRIPYLRDLRGMILGLGLDTSRSDILSGLALGVSLHIATILNAMKKYVGGFREPLFSGGGYSMSNALLQTLADITGMQVARPVDVEVSSFGVAKLLALSDGKLSKKDLREKPAIEKLFSPSLNHIDRSAMLDAYSKLLGVISRCLRDQSLKKIF